MKLRLLALTLLSSVLLALALPNELLPYGNPLLGLFCVSPFLAAVILSPTHRFAVLLGMVFGGISTLLSNFWLMFFQSYTFWTLGGVTFVYIVFNAVLAPVLRGFSKMLPATYRPFAAALIWSLYEYLKSVGFLGFPWGLIAYPVHSLLPVIQFADITGVWGISFLMALCNAVLAERLLVYLRPVSPFISPSVPWVNQLGVVLCLAGLAVVYGIVRLSTPVPFDKTVNLLLVQQNTDTWTDGSYAEQGLLSNLRLSTVGYEEADPKPDMIVWSETSIGYDVQRRREIFEKWPPKQPLLPTIRALGTYLLSGSRVEVSAERNEIMNGVVLISPDGSVVDHYGKQHPVPFAETIPFWHNDTVRRFFRDVVHIWNPSVMGDRYTVFELPLAGASNLKFATPICFEDAFSDLCRRFVLDGAELWINLTNDYWSRTVTAEIQHFVAAKFRTIENRRTLVRSTNGGVSAVVDPAGRVLAALPLFTSAYMNVSVPIRVSKKATPYTRYGDYFPKILALIVLFVVLCNTLRNHGPRKIRDVLQGTLH